MHLDFSENYSPFYQQEISSAHWMKNLITVHSFVVFYKCPDCGDGAKPVSDVRVFLTDDTQHDHHAGQEFMTKALKFLKEERDVPFRKVYEYTDRCSAQYKSRGRFVDISFGEADFGIKRKIVFWLLPWKRSIRCCRWSN